MGLQVVAVVLCDVVCGKCFPRIIMGGSGGKCGETEARRLRGY